MATSLKSPLPTTPPLNKAGDGTTSNTGMSNCTQLQANISNLTRQIQFWNLRLQSTPGPEGPGTARNSMEQTIALLEQELSSTRTAFQNGGCMGVEQGTDCITAGTTFTTSKGAITIKGAICTKWHQLATDKDAFGRSVQEILGLPTDNTQFIFQRNRELIVQNFEGGVIIDIQGDNNPKVVYGAILTLYLSLGSVNGFLGVPLTDETNVSVGFGRFNDFETGTIYWTPSTGTHEIHGTIFSKWVSLGREKSVLGFPVSNQTATPDNIGSFNRFQNGMIYSSSSTAACEIHGPILNKWSSMGFERSMLGYPISDTTTTPDGIGSFNRFQNGMVYNSLSSGAHEIHGAILDKWSSIGFERSYLGYPITDEELASDGVSKKNGFQNGRIYFTSGGDGAIDYPDSITFPTPTLGALGDTASGNLILNSNGSIILKVHVEGDDFIGSDNFVFVIGANVNGAIYAFPKQGSVGSTLFGKKTFDSDDTLFDQRVIDNWNTLKNCSFTTHLHVSENVGVVIEEVLASIFIAGGIILVIGVAIFGGHATVTDPDGNSVTYAIPPAGQGR